MLLTLYENAIAKVTNKLPILLANLTLGFILHQSCRSDLQEEARVLL